MRINFAQELDVVFKVEINRLTLRFKDQEQENNYTAYKIHVKETPLWFKCLMWSLITIIALRRMQLLLYSLLGVPSIAGEPAVEIITVTVLLCASVFEFICWMCNSVAYLKGAGILLSSFFMISYNSHIYFPTKPGIIPL
jgi:hypothetical protein